MKIFISVVSHGHSNLIKELKCISTLIRDYKVVIKSNTPHEDFQEFEQYDNFYLIDRDYGLGFGHNNNVVFKFCRDELNMVDDDLFLILNPDVSLAPETLYKLSIEMLQQNVSIATINLYKDVNFEQYDPSIRRFPTLIQFSKSFLGLGNSSILDKNNIFEPLFIDWSAGSFIIMKAKLYNDLKGFDESYFMYCEDIDLCYRSSKVGFPVVYYPNFKAVHLAKHANRKFFSKHFFWHLSSAIRFLCSKHFDFKVKSSIG